jgi:hypothetical protein
MKRHLLIGGAAGARLEAIRRMGRRTPALLLAMLLARRPTSIHTLEHARVLERVMAVTAPE